MSKINVNIRLDQELRNSASRLAEEMGTNLSTVINIFLIKFTKERKLEISANDTVFEDFSKDEMEKIKGLSNFNSFMTSIRGK